MPCLLYQSCRCSTTSTTILPWPQHPMLQGLRRPWHSRLLYSSTEHRQGGLVLGLYLLQAQQEERMSSCPLQVLDAVALLESSC